jgi:ubiquinone/menaquinone biosynthesis C-methylase UbiE
MDRDLDDGLWPLLEGNDATARRARAGMAERPRAIRRWVDRAAYHVQHQGLALSLGLLLRVYNRLLGPSVGAPSLEALRAVQRRFLALLAEDLANVEAGLYPRELLFQLPVAQYLKTAPLAVIDAPRMVLRKRRNNFEDLPRAAWVERYPAYYRRNFHWQTDGWLSDRSARLYDLDVEVLFGGTADVMRRAAIAPIALAARERPSVEVVDLACGTGRFLLQLARSLPRARLSGVDLSAPYLRRARRLLGDRQVELVEANAEATPLASGRYDAVASIFLFHELPGDARRNVAREALRLLKPGGTFVIVDSTQRGDATELAFFLEAFSALYHEPYFKGYLDDDLGDLLVEVGFSRPQATTHFVSKRVVAIKP